MRGLILIFTGDGKGKTTAALGTILRAVGHGMRCLLVQFLKAREGVGELKALKEHLPKVEVRQRGLGFVLEGGNLEPHMEAARRAWEEAVEAIQSGRFDLVVLDEVNVAMAKGLLPPSEVARFLRDYAGRAHLILTGRGAPPQVVEAADLVTEFKEVRHYFREGLKAVKGLDW